MPEFGFQCFLWMTMGFTIMYLLVLSTLTTSPKKQSVLATTSVSEARRRKRRRAFLVANAAVRRDLPASNIQTNQTDWSFCKSEDLERLDS
jgi:heme exporter protein D